MQLSDEQKYKIIFLREENYKINEIANKMDINRKTVMKWINNYARNKNIERKKGSGRKKITSSEEDKSIFDTAKKNNDLSIVEIKNILEEKDIIISVTTVYRRLINENFSYKFPIKKPFLTDDHKKKRLEWAKENLNRDWSKIIFSDESTLRISGFNKKLWIHENDVVITRIVKYPLKKNIWGCFFQGKIGSIHIFTENMNADKYIQILDDYLVPIIKYSNKKFIFQHDNDPKHTANKTKQFLEDSDITVLEWPSCSPDLNPIENVWKILKEKVHKCKSKNSDEFVENIMNEWNNFDTEILKSLINSMPYRIRQVIDNNGDTIPY
jgi:transposase